MNPEILPGFENALPANVSGWLVSEQPAARIEAFGPAALSDGELLALVMQGAGMDPIKARETAQRVLAGVGSLAGCAGWTATEWRAAGCGDLRSAQLVAVCELGRRLLMPAESPILDKPAGIAQFMASRVVGLEVEKFWVLCLNRRNRLLKCVAITSGTATAALAHPREVFRTAIRESATAVVCVHNHPSGDPAPSAPDINITRQLREAARTVDINLLDHVVIGRAGADPMGRGFYSFREAGLL